MKKIIIVVSLIVLIGLGLNCGNTRACSGNYGDVIGHFKDVELFSNGDSGDCSGTSNGALKYQCVALIKRFYEEAMGVNLYSRIGVARNYYEYFNSNVVYFTDSSGNPYSIDFSYIRNRGFERVANDYSGTISVGDILVFNAPAGTGHVAIVSDVNLTTNRITVVEQNVHPTDYDRVFNLLTQNNNHRIDNTSILGWLHMPIGEFENDEQMRNGIWLDKGWHFDSDIWGQSNHYNLNSRPFTESYNNNGGRDVLGLPVSKVYEFPSSWNPYTEYSPYHDMRKAWIQDFQKGGNAYSLVVNEYVFNLDEGYLGAAYPIGGQIRTYWKNNYWEIGYPVSNEYFYNPNQVSPPEFTVQWFEKLDEEYHVVIYNNHTGEIWRESGSTTLILMPNLSEFREQASSYDFVPEGEGGGPPPPSSDYSLERTTMCKSVQDIDPYEPITETTLFQNEDKKAYSWIKVTNVHVPLHFKFKWYNLAGTFLTEWEYTSTDPQDEGYAFWDWYKVWCWLDISTLDYYGQYRVDIYIEGEKVATDYFDITIDLDAPINLTIQEITETSAFFHWHGSTAPEYNIYRDDLYIATTNVNYYTDSGLVPGTTYIYTVQAKKGNAVSYKSTPLSVTTDHAPYEPAPEADFSVSANTGYVPLTLLFTDNSTGEIDSWIWHFGDGSTSTEKNPVHTYHLAGTYTVTLIVSGPGGADEKVMFGYITVTNGDLPSPWLNTDVGEPYLAGSASYNGANATFTINGSGRDIWYDIDEFYYVYQSLSGDGEIIARVTSQTSTEDWAKAGIMIKESVTAGDNYVGFGVTPANGLAFQYEFYNHVPGGAYSFPVWLKLKRIGDIFTAYRSTDGLSWTEVESTNIEMAADVTIGLFVTSHNGGVIDTAQFDNVSVTNFTNDLPNPWQKTEIGNPDLSGDASYNGANATFTINGSGRDIWYDIDEFYYVYQSLSGDGEIIARVTSQTSTEDWAKAGIMIKESVTAGDNYVGFGVTPANGLAFQYEFYNHVPGGAYSFPVWLKLKRIGNIFTAYRSTDGQIWIGVGSTNIEMAADVTIGLFVTSHNGGVIDSARFDNVTVTDLSTGTEGIELLDPPWYLSGNNGADEEYQSVDSDVLNGMESVTITYDLNGLCALSGDASAVIFDQKGDWQYISLSDYGTNCHDGEQTVTIPLSDFGDLDPESPLTGPLHTRFWYGSSFEIDIISIKINPITETP